MKYSKLVLLYLIQWCVLCSSIDAIETMQDDGASEEQTTPSPSTEETKAPADLDNPTFAVVDSGAQNSSGTAINVEWTQFNTPFFATISPSGITKIPDLNPYSPSAASALTTLNKNVVVVINSMAQNSSGSAVVGGWTQSYNPFFALISPSGKSTLPAQGPDSPKGTGAITAVAINSTGSAIIGGIQEGFTSSYAALISPTGTLTAVTGETPKGDGAILAVAINESGYAIIGGSAANEGSSSITVSSESINPTKENLFQTDSNPSYAVIVKEYSNEFRPPYIAPISLVQQISILTDGNALGSTIIHEAKNGFQNAYAAFVNPSGVAIAINGPGFPPSGSGSKINSVDINNAGFAIIGGVQNATNDPYAALVSPIGAIQSLTGDTPQPGGYIQSVAINDTGAAVIGGVDNHFSEYYVALVSPSGIATKLPDSVLLIPMNSTNMSNTVVNLLEAATPQSWGPGSSFANALFTLSSDLLPNHLQCQQIAPEEKTNPENWLLVDVSKSIRKSPACLKPDYCIWGALFGDYAHQKNFQTIPTWTQWIGGSVIGCDYRGLDHWLFGASAAYAYSSVNLSEGIGHAQSDQEFASLYGAWLQEHFYISWALWGGYYQLTNERCSLAAISANSKVRGWLGLPHLEFGFPIFCGVNQWRVVPFGMLDWANNWQHQVHEKGKSGFNLLIPSQYTSLLRSEAGVRLFQTFHFGPGSLLLEEKLSYVNKAPFNTSPATTFFVGSISSFPIDLFSSELQNLGVVQFSLQFAPRQGNWPYGGINYQAEFGSSFQIQTISLEIGREF